MKKFYSFVLMACALLLCTNVWATPLAGNTWGALQDAIFAIMNDDNVTSGEITLTQDVTLEEGKTIWVGTKDLNGAYKSITINLNGHNITMNANNSKPVMFALTHGELKIINNSATESLIQFTGSTKSNSRLFAVYGSYRSSRWNEDGDALVADSINTRDQGWFSHLEIGQNVKLYAAPDCLVEGIAICSDLTANTYYKNSTSEKETLSYDTWIFTTSSHGLAQGVRVDFDGKMDLVGNTDDGGKVYGISTKGTVRSNLSADPNNTKNAEKIRDKFLEGKSNPIAYLYHYYSYNDSIHKAENGITHRLDTLDAPFVWVHPNAEINVRNDGDKVAGIYAAGYAKWLVQGYVAGKTGFYVSSGTVDLVDAYVKSTANNWETTSAEGSANGGGSGVVINSREAYSGDIEFAVGGDTKIESIGGYAIEEAVNTSPTKPNPEHATDPSAPEYIADTKVSVVKIETGTIVGGEKGAIIIADATKTAAQQENSQTSVVVYGGNITGETKVGTDGDLNTLLPTTEEYYTTTVTVGTQTVVVVNKGNVSNIEDAAVIASASDSIRWTGTSETLYADKALDYVEMNQDGAQILIIGDPENEDADKRFVTFTVGRVIMDADAQIIVNPGSRLIITGKDGIVAPSVSNITLRNQGALNAADRKHAHFLVSPQTSGNRHPNATVELTSYSWRNNDNEYQYERFGIPTHEGLKSIACVENAVPTYFCVYTDHWEDLGYLNFPGHTAVNPADFKKPFATYELLANRNNSNLSTTAPKYQLAGELLGNDDASLHVNLLWTPFTNSYSADVDLLALLSVVENAQIVDPYVYFATLSGVASGHYHWSGVDAEKINLGETTITKLSPMQAFIIRKDEAKATLVEDIPVNYNSMVYSPATTNNAPARQVSANDYTARLSVIIANEFTSDDVVLRETETRTKQAVKYMNDDLNIYAMSEKNACIYAVEDLENTYLGVSTVRGGEFTISFANVVGREFDLIDLETGAKVAASEGATYQFHLNANTVADYRFKLVERAKLPTAIENTEVKANVKGIYTITGQYLGEMNVWNSLPAGIYVVNGAKRVK